MTEALSDSELTTLRFLLSNEELARSVRFSRTDDQRDFVAAHGLLHILLRQNYPHLPIPAPFCKPETGIKPRFKLGIETEVDFNITHTRGMVACVTASGFDVGIDCERLDREIDGSLAELCFSDGERAWLDSQRHLPAHEAFVHIWTLKEAVVKATGFGLTSDLKAFTVLPFPPRLSSSDLALGPPNNWRLWQWRPGAEFVVALAMREKMAVKPSRANV